MMHRNLAKSKNSSCRSTPSPLRSKMEVKASHCCCVTANGCEAESCTMTSNNSRGSRTPFPSLSRARNCSENWVTNFWLTSSLYTASGSSGITLTIASRSFCSWWSSRSTARLLLSTSTSIFVACPSGVSMNDIIIMYRTKLTNSSLAMTPFWSISKRSTKRLQCSSVSTKEWACVSSWTIGNNSAGSRVPLPSLSNCEKNSSQDCSKIGLDSSCTNASGRNGSTSQTISDPVFKDCRTDSNFSFPNMTSAINAS
mmetsp:Transcript_1327/g.3420  ORF Transcript_1327/g.3420 Transcript_1327/m.3420 type:complete len:255 (-) Transcript_1327:1764-2528(-)